MNNLFIAIIIVIAGAVISWGILTTSAQVPWCEVPEEVLNQYR